MGNSDSREESMAVLPSPQLYGFSLVETAYPHECVFFSSLPLSPYPSLSPLPCLVRGTFNKFFLFCLPLCMFYVMEHFKDPRQQLKGLGITQ